MWQAATFDPATIDRELGYAAGIGMTVMRVFLHDLPFSEDSSGFINRIELFLDIAAQHRIKIMFVLFDGCWRPDGRLGPQPTPLKRYHNSRWLQSPLLETLRESNWDGLQAYVKGVISRFADDTRVHSWDLYNEVDNWQIEISMWLRFCIKRSTRHDFLLRYQLLVKAFHWARECDPCQPLTACEWEFISNKFREAIQKRADIGTFHIYSNRKDTENEIARMKTVYQGRPLLLTEYLARSIGSTFEANLELLKKHDVGAINWGLVEGKTGTIWPWWSWILPWQWYYSILKFFGFRGDYPNVWFHDVFWQNGEPFCNREASLIKRLTSALRPINAVMHSDNV